MGCPRPVGLGKDSGGVSSGFTAQLFYCDLRRRVDDDFRLALIQSNLSRYGHRFSFVLPRIGKLRGARRRYLQNATVPAGASGGEFPHAWQNSALFEIALVLVRVDQFASPIVNTNPTDVRPDPTCYSGVGSCFLRRQTRAF
jgi:hypothetical protein